VDNSIHKIDKYLEKHEKEIKKIKDQQKKKMKKQQHNRYVITIKFYMYIDDLMAQNYYASQ